MQGMKHTGHDAPDVEVQPVGHVDRMVRRVRRVQHQGVRRHLQALDRTGITQDGHDYLLVCWGERAVNDENISLMNAHPNHSVACYPQIKGSGWMYDQEVLNVQ